MTTAYSISEAKSKLSEIGRNVKKNSNISVLKNGKPFFNIISPEDYKVYQKLLLGEKIRKWDKSLEWEEISKEDAISIAEAKKEIHDSVSRAISAEELMDLITE